MRRLTAVIAVLLGLALPGVATAQSICQDVGGAVTADRRCHLVSAGPTYSVDLEFPTEFADQRAVADYLAELRDGFIGFAQRPPTRTAPFTLEATTATYRSGDAATGTESVVLKVLQDANPRPVAWYKTFNFDLATRTPITLATLFVPGTDVVDVVLPAVRRQLEKRWPAADLDDMIGAVDESTFEQFAVTDDTVLFYFGQGRLVGYPEGLIDVAVPRSELAPLLA